MTSPRGRRVRPHRGDRGALDGVEAAVLSGSTAGVYEDDENPWIEGAREVVRELIERETPTLGICFGPQLVNDALGGRVEHRGVRAGLAAAEFDDDPLFEGVPPVVPAVHGDIVVEADGDRLFANFRRLARLERPRSQS